MCQRQNNLANIEDAKDIAIAMLSWSEFYDACKALRLNYARKLKKQSYDETLAIKGMENLVYSGLRSDYARKAYANFVPETTPATRKEIARIVLDHWEDEIKELAEKL